VYPVQRQAHPGGRQVQVMGLIMVSVATIGITMAVNGGQGHIED
jgi:hypothetical protein